MLLGHGAHKVSGVGGEEGGVQCLLGSLFPVAWFQFADADRCARRQAQQRGERDEGRMHKDCARARATGLRELGSNIQCLFN